MLSLTVQLGLGFEEDGYNGGEQCSGHAEERNGVCGKEKTRHFCRTARGSERRGKSEGEETEKGWSGGDYRGTGAQLK